MMPGRTDQAQSPPIAAVITSATEAMACRQPAEPQVPNERTPRVRVKRSAAPCFELLDIPDVCRFMNSQEFVVGGFTHLPRWAGLDIPGSLQVVQDRNQPLGPLRVFPRHAMLDHPPIRVQGNGHGCSCGLALAGMMGAGTVIHES